MTRVAPVAAFEPSGERPQYPIESVGNALRLLMMFQKTPRVRLSAARDELGVAQSTAHRLMAMLVYYGFVRQDPLSRTYLAGPALLDIGLSVVRSMDIRTVAREVLESLCRTTGETAHLAQLEGPNVRFLDGVESEHALRVAGRTGRTLPAYATSIGKALLAELDPAQLRALYPDERLLDRPTEKTLSTRTALEAELEKVRRRGYATNSGESEDGVSSVGVAVVHPERGPVAALSVAAPLARMPAPMVRVAAGHLRNAAAELSRRLT